MQDAELRTINQFTNMDFDTAMAKLLVQASHYSLSGCSSTISEMVVLLNHVLHHPDIEHYPEQQKVLIKMLHLWRTKLFGLQHRLRLH